MKSELETLSEGEVQNPISIKILPSQKPSKPPNNENRNKSDLGCKFIAPDGGWGWLVVIAAAISILVTFAVLDKFEIFRTIGISSSEMATIINIQHAAATCTALLNGEIFRRFTIRQISSVGAILIFFGLALTAFVNSFVFYIFTLSIMCGIGKSLIFSSSFIAVNTYFEENRRSAIAYMYSITGLGQIFLPHLTTFLLGEYGVTMAILFYAGLSLHNFASSLIYQPAKWHSRKQQDDIEMDEIRPINFVFGSRYIDKLTALENLSTNSNSDLNSLDCFSTQTQYPLRVPKNSVASFAPLSRPPIPKIILPDETEYLESPQDVHHESIAKENKKTPSILQKISMFFDLDLLANFSYVNLVVGLTLIHFVEINFALMTPFILNDSGFNEKQITKALLTLAVCDVLMRMAIPFMLRNSRCSDKGILMCGLIGTCIGRTILVFSRNFTMVRFCFGWIGLCSAIRIVFWMLILPSCMPLKRLPAAVGLQQVATGIVFLTFGQLRGLIEDASNHSLVLLCMNAIYSIVLFAWLGEDIFRQRRKLDEDK